MYRVCNLLFYQLFEVSLKLFVYFSLILELILEYCDLVMFSYNIFLIESYYIRISLFIIFYLGCVWILRFTPFAVLFFYIISDSYGSEKKKSNFLVPLMVFQSIVLLKTVVILCLSIYFEDIILKREESWFIFISPYSLFTYYFLKPIHYISVGYLSQLGFNVYVFVILYCHYKILRWKSKNYPYVEIKSSVRRADLVKSIII